MADEIAINIYLNGEGKGQTATEQAVGNGGNIEGMSQASNTGSNNDKALSKLKKYVASQTIDVFIGNVKSQLTSNIGLITGKSELQQRVNFGMSIVQQGVNTYKNAMAGATLTASLGMGGPIGVAIGVALSAISTGINLIFKEQQMSIQKNIEDRQINEIRSRQGAWVNRSRRGL